MAEARAEVRLLLSTMRMLDGSSSLVRALGSLEDQHRLSVVVIVAQESQRVMTEKFFPTAEFQVRGLGEWPQTRDSCFTDEVVSSYSTLVNLPGFLDVKRQVIASLNRHDSSGTFRLVDREIYFQQSLLEILSLLARNRVTHLFLDITPHVSRDYMLYWVAGALGLKVMFLQPVPWAGLAIPKHGLFGSVPPHPGIWNIDDSAEVSDFFNYSIGQGKNLVHNLKESNAGWVARYQGPEIRKLESRPPTLAKSFASVRQKMRGQNSISFSGIHKQGLVEKLLAVLLEWRLRRDFVQERSSVNSHELRPHRDYVFFALTHEPERTFFPEALPYESQFEVALQIASNLKPGFTLLVKEHETQFVPGRRGYASRSLQFYRTLIQVENIEVVPSIASAKSLVRNASAVVSATGTICLEAALQGKRSYYFGNPWWVGFPGTTKLQDFEGISTDDCAIPTESAIEHWLSHFVAQCVPTTSNVDIGDFSQKFAPLPEYFHDLEERSIRLTLQDFIDGP